METFTQSAVTLRSLREQSGLTAKELAAKISQFLGEAKERDQMSVIMMERRGSQDSAKVRDALEFIFSQYEISAADVRAACRGNNITNCL